LAVALAASAWTVDLPDSLRDRVRENIGRHVDAETLTAWRDSCDTEAAAAFDFLFAWLPPSDLAAWRADQVISDVRLALKTRQEAPWRDEIDDALFTTYVLPHRVSQEPIQPWRRELHELLWDRVKGKTLREAALEVNRFCREHATFKGSSFRDQGPLTTMERGIGRCEEEMIFFASAARSVGIPARQCFTPYWMANDNNHAWNEVWTGDGWHYLGACEPTPDVDIAWFTEAARRAGVVLSTAYGEWLFPNEEVYRQRDGQTLINSTDVYTTPGRVAIRWHGADITPVHVHIFNWGSLTQLCEFAAEDEMVLGPGDYVLGAEIDSVPVLAAVTVRAGERSVVTFDPDLDDSSRLGWLEDGFWLRYPVPLTGDASDRPTVEPLTQRTHELAISRNDLCRSERARLDAGTTARIAARAAREIAERGDRLEAILAHIESAGVRMGAWSAFLAATEGDTFSVAADLILEMDVKDFFECDSSSARTALRESIRLRVLRDALPDTIWTEFVLSPRIDRQPGDFAMWTNLPLLHRDGALADARFVHRRFAEAVRAVDRTRFGSISTPSEVWKLGVATEWSARVGLVGLLRRNGIPARVPWREEWVDVWVDGEWIPVDPLDADSWNRREGGISAAYATSSRLTVSFLDLGAPMIRAEGWRHFRLARLEDGRFEPLYAEYPVRDGRLEMEIAPGEWWLFGGQRNHAGCPRVAVQRFTAEAGQTVELEMDIGIPADERDPKDLAPRQLSGELLSTFGLEPWPDDLDAETRLLFVWTEGSEACRRTADALHSALDDAGPGLSLKEFEVTTDDELSGIVDDRSRLPVVALIERGSRRTLLFTTGIQLAIGDLIRQAMLLGEAGR